MGKVHGSLTRAGKVRGQTPKVEKQPKKRSIVGRQSLRAKANRRNALIQQSQGGAGGQKVKINSQPGQAEKRVFKTSQVEKLKEKLKLKKEKAVEKEENKE